MTGKLPPGRAAKRAAKRVLAMVYDFDKTLIDGNMFDQGLIGDVLGEDPDAFWKRSNRLADENAADRTCMYMHLLRTEAEEAGRPLTRGLLQRYGSRIEFRGGLVGRSNWFSRTRRIGREHGLDVSHYVITSGSAEMVEASGIARHLEKPVFGSRFLYDGKGRSGRALGPAHATNYTTKTQHLFRINKGVKSLGDDNKLNEYRREADRPVPFRNMVFIGDGYTDIPCFRLVKEQSGHSLAVLADSSDQALAQAETLMRDGRIDGLCLHRPFERGSGLEKHFLKIVDILARDGPGAQ